MCGYAVTQAFEIMPRMREEVYSSTYSDAVISVAITDAKNVPQTDYRTYGSWVAQTVSWVDGKNFKDGYTLVSEVALKLCKDPPPPPPPTPAATAGNPAAAAPKPATPAPATPAAPAATTPAVFVAPAPVIPALLPNPNLVEPNFADNSWCYVNDGLSLVGASTDAQG